jgi:mannose-6-phosphate isomerase-like protein (cupin superfamily)
MELPWSCQETIVQPAEHRGAFFRVLQQMAASQTAVMTIAAGQEAGPEEAHGGDQIVYVLERKAEMQVGAARLTAGPGALVPMPAGARHHVRNPGPDPLFLLTVYAPPEY